MAHLRQAQVDTFIIDNFFQVPIDTLLYIYFYFLIISTMQETTVSV